MASLKFYLTRPNIQAETAIFFFLNYGAYEMINGKKKYLPFKYYTSESIKPIYWNSKTGRVKETKKFPEYPEFNTRLQDIESKTLSTFRQLQNDGVDITTENIRDALDIILKPGKAVSNKKMEFMEYLRYYMNKHVENAETLKSYKQAERALTDYEDAKHIKLTFKRIDIDFHADFISYLRSVKKYAPNTIGTRIKVIKTIMRAAFDRGLHTNSDFQKKAFKKPTENTKSIYLNDSELERLFNLDLSTNKSLENVRDWFILAAYTGLRISDFSRLTKENIIDDTITIKTQKTGEEVVIPFHSFVRAILEKYDYAMPKIISNQKFNDYIKTVCEMAELTESVLIERQEGNMTVTTKEPKYNLVSAHTARRSFATNAFLAKVPPIQIMKITGHQTEKVFMTYIKMSGKENADSLKLHPFFTKMIVNK